MRPADRIPPEPWMTGGAGAAVWRCLADGGVTARFVGGPARNAVMGLPVSDLDMASDAAPERVMELARARGLRAVPTGLDHGTVTLIVDHVPVEVTALRRDVETDGRRAKIALTDDWAEDAARRDFTLNALYLDPDGTLYDPTGRGLSDAREGRIRFVGDPETRIREDGLRILRLFRFLASHGRTDPDTAALEACRRLAPMLDILSGERIWRELRKLLAAPGADHALALMADRGVADHLWPGDVRIPQARRLIAIEDRLHRAADPVRRLAAMLGQDHQRGLERLRSSNAERHRIAHAVNGALDAPDTDRATRAILYRLGAEITVDRLLLTKAESQIPVDEAAARIAQALALADDWTAPAFPLSGADVVALGIAPGPPVGALLRAVEDWWIERDFTPGRTACLSALRERIKGGQ